jgi:hypothetical protein
VNQCQFNNDHADEVLPPSNTCDPGNPNASMGLRQRQRRLRRHQTCDAAWAHRGGVHADLTLTSNADADAPPTPTPWTLTATGTGTQPPTAT